MKELWKDIPGYNGKYCTNSENQLHAYKLGLQSRRSGEKAPKAKLTELQVIQILQDSRTQREIAEEYGVSRFTICEIKRGINWSMVY